MFLLHCQADDEPVHHLSIMTSIKPCETSMPMFLKLGLDLSHGSMAAMKHLLLIYLPEATISYLLAYDDMIYDYCLSCIPSKRQIHPWSKYSTMDHVNLTFPWFTCTH
jgi:hypothetical protein